MVRFDGIMHVTTAGTLGLFAACGTSAADTYLIYAVGPYMTLEPIGP
jgi:hypothetical protein